MTTRSFRLSAPATTANVGPGFDCLGAALSMHLRLACTSAASFSLEMHGEGTGSVPTDATNLLVRAMLSALGSETPPPVRLRVDNDVPLERGLGSSSAAIVTGLAAGRLLAGVSFDAIDRYELVGAATRFEGHPDNVAPAILGDLVVSGVEGDDVLATQMAWPDDLSIVAIVPDLRISTEAARRALPDSVSFGDAVANGGRLARLLAALATRDYTLLRSALDDRLHQPYRLPLAPALPDVLAALHDHEDAYGAYLSGSGPTLAVLCRQGHEERVGAAGVDAFRRSGVDSRFHALAVDRQGLTYEE